MPIDSAWVGSTVSIPRPEQIIPQSGLFSETAVGIFTLCILLIILIFGKKLASVIPQLFSFIFFPNDSRKINENHFVSSALVAIFILCCPIFIALCEKYQILSIDYFPQFNPSYNFIFLLSILLLIFLIRKLLLHITGSVTKKGVLFSTISKTTIFFFCIAVTISLLPLPLTFLIDEPNYHIFRIVIYSLFGLIFLFYLFYIRKIIISSGVSPFFCFLYLCTLEILPASLIVGTLVKI